MPIKLILYVKPECCLCEGLQEKLQQIRGVEFELEVRDITTNSQWFDRYQYEIPVLCLWQIDRELELPRISPRSTVAQVESSIASYIGRSS